MKVHFAPVVIGFALMCTVNPTAAQEERGQLWEVQTISVRPDHMDEFMEGLGTVKAAAEAAHLPAEYGWNIWVKDFDVAIASMAPDMASFDDPEAWIRQFQGTPGEAMVNEAMGRFMTQIAAQPSNREVYEHVVSWSYAPAQVSFESPSFAQRHDFWIKPGMGEAFENTVKDIMAFQAEMNSPYPVNGYRMQFGDSGRATFLVMNDGWADFYGKNDMEAKMEATGTTAKWEGIMSSLRDCITAYESSQMEHIADLSYSGPGM